MKNEIILIPTDTFSKEYKRLLKKYPSLKGKGKSGGARVVTFNLLAEIDNQRVVLVTIFDKGERESMSVESLRTVINNSGF